MSVGRLPAAKIYVPVRIKRFNIRRKRPRPTKGMTNMIAVKRASGKRVQKTGLPIEKTEDLLHLLYSPPGS